MSGNSADVFSSRNNHRFLHTGYLVCTVIFNIRTRPHHTLLSILDAKKKRAFRRSIDGNTSAWLAVLRLCTHHFDLSATEFRDAMAMRYQRPLLRMPATCDGCGAAFNLEHALDCRKGGLVIQRHNEIRDALGDLASIAFRQECDKGASCEGG